MNLQCPACHGSFVAEGFGQSATVRCPHCGESVRRPAGSTAQSADDFDFDLEFLADDRSDAGSPIFEETPHTVATGTSRTCPMCGESVPANAPRCQACGEELPLPGPDRNQPQTADIKTRYRQQIVAVGAFWVFVGLLLGAVAVFFLSDAKDLNPADQRESILENERVALGLAIFAFALIHFVVGTLAIGKLIPAVYVGLVLTYVSLALCALSIFAPILAREMAFGCCGGIFWGVLNIVVVLQTHRVLRWSKQITL